MVASTTGHTQPKYPKKFQQGQKRKREHVDPDQLQNNVSQLDSKAVHTSFSELPLSHATASGLKGAHFSTLTDIQAKTIPLALQGRDILGAAKTGSGKTLAFLVPVLENLFRARCIGADAGLGAMIISPTRELAIQIFEVLRKIGGKGHFFAAGLVIGGKALQAERDALTKMNIVVCTPGRILQHLSQTAMFNVDSLRMLVLDEADRIMDMGFQRDVDAIVEYLPADRQTLLFSATQTKRVSDLSRLALKDPEYISVHEAAATSTPKSLQQNYVVTALPDKLDTLWSFLQASKKSKIIVFFSSGKQVRFVYESFRHMQPGIPLLHLHGRQKQTARLDITQSFSQAKYSCLFATDVIARGLDFPAVDWVIQVDCPEDADTYIHRVGRTARYERDGRAVLFLDPSEEEGMLKRLEAKRVPIERINVRQKKQQSIKNQLQSMCFKDPTLKYLGQRAFTTYVRSLHIQKDREIFQLSNYALEEYAAALGLPGAPRIKFLQADADERKRRKNAPRQQMDLSGSEDEKAESKDNTKSKNGGVRTKYDRMFERRNQDILADHYKNMVRDESDGKDDVETGRLSAHDEDEDLFDVKRRIAADDALGADDEIEKANSESGQQSDEGAKHVNIAGAKAPLLLDSKRREKLLKSKKKMLRLKDRGSKLVFDDDGNARQIYELEDEEAFKAKGDVEDQRKRFLEEESARIRRADADDKTLAKQKKRERKERRKQREREEEGGDLQIGGPEVDGDQDAMANFLADAASENEGAYSEDEKPRKKEKKWFENDRSNGRTGQMDGARELGTFDELEAEAAKLLG